MKTKFESSVNSILLLMFTSVLVLMAFSNCCSQSKEIRNSDNPEVQVKDSINDDTIR